MKMNHFDFGRGGIHGGNWVTNIAPNRTWFNRLRKTSFDKIVSKIYTMTLRLWRDLQKSMPKTLDKHRTNE